MRTKTSDRHLKVYELLLERDAETGEVKYNDFIRSVDRNISEEKNEIRYNIAEYGMDKKVGRLIEEFLATEEGKEKLENYSNRYIVARVEWNEVAKSVRLVAVGFYDRGSNVK